jgi:hypothetical protein
VHGRPIKLVESHGGHLQTMTLGLFNGVSFWLLVAGASLESAPRTQLALGS